MPTSTPPEPAGAAATEGAGRRAGRLAGARVLVVGGGTRPAPQGAPVGNGRAISVLAAREGARVAVADCDAGAAGETVRMIGEAGGAGEVLVADVADAGQAEGLPERAAAALDGLDCLVLNVGIGDGLGLAGTDAATWDRVFAVNARAHFLILRAALPLLTRSAVVVGSVAAHGAGSLIPAYDASKAALSGLVRHTALEGAGRGVRVNLVVPGLIDTPLGRLASEAVPGRGSVLIPLGRQGTAWEVAAAAVFLLSSDASYITGTSLVVDGGRGALI